MGKQTIGLDIGTHAVRAVELSYGRGRPAVRRMGQVTLPSGAVVAGEVVEPDVVAAALKRLWHEVGFSDKSVVVGVANSKIVARLADLPALPEDELRASLRFHVQDLIPMPMDEVELDFQPLESTVTETGEARERVLLVAAHREMLESLLSAVEGAGLTPARIDLIPLALVRAVHDEWDWAGEAVGEQEVIVGIGAGVTNVVIHQQGSPRFVRTLPIGGAAITDALVRDLELESGEAEARKRALGVDGADDERQVTETAVAVPVSQLANDIAGSLDFHLAQSESSLRRVVLTGGGTRLRLLGDVLTEQVGVTVVAPQAYAGLDTSKVPLDAAVVEAAADSFTVAVGLALQPLGAERRAVNLLPSRIAAARTQQRQRVLAGAGAAAFLAVLAGATMARGAQVDAARYEAEQAEDRRAALETQVGALRDVELLEAAVAEGGRTVTAALAGDIAWTGLIEGVTAHLPEDVWVTSFSASRGLDATPGTVQIAAVGFDHTSTARWLQRAEELDALANPWVSSSVKSELPDGRSTVQITATADLGPGAASDRLAYYLGAE